MKDTITNEEAVKLILAKVKDLGSQRAVAAEFGKSEQFISDIINGRRDVSDEVAQKLGYRRVIVFERVK